MRKFGGRENILIRNLANWGGGGRRWDERGEGEERGRGRVCMGQFESDDGVLIFISLLFGLNGGNGGNGFAIEGEPFK